MEDFKMQALEEILKTIKKQISNEERNLQGVRSANQTAQSLVHITYKGYELYSYEDIQTLYANAEITEKRMEILYNELMDKRKNAGLQYNIDKLSAKLDYWRKFEKDVYNTIHWEEK